MKRAFSVSLLLALLLTGCGGGSSQPSAEGSSQSPAEEPATGIVFAMDTMMEISYYGDGELLPAVQDRIEELDGKLSTTDENSEIYAVNHSGSGSLSEDTAWLLGRALELCGRTDGALDLSIYPVVRTWGFTTGEYSVPDRDTLEELLNYVDYTKINLDEDAGQVTLLPGMEIDLGSVAKGYTGDQICTMLRESGITSAKLNLGGNVQTVGGKPDGSPWRIAVQNPFGEGYVGILEVTGQAVITSGGYERFFEEDGETYWHIIDPSTGAPARSGLVSVTIVGSSGLLCDGLSTAVFIMGLDNAVNFWRESNDFEMLLVGEDGEIYLTEGLEEVFTLPEPASGLGEVTVIRRD